MAGFRYDEVRGPIYTITLRAGKDLQLGVYTTSLRRRD